MSGQAYTGAQSFTLTPADTGGSGLAGTWWRLDGGAWTAGTLVPVAAPPSGTELHTLSWYSTDNATNTESAQSVSFSVTAAGGGAGTTSIVMSGEPPWVDAESGASGAWGTFTIYANGVSIGSKPVDATSTWDCPQTSVPSGARIDIVVDCGFSALGELYGQYRPLTYTTYLPAGSTRLEAATWTGFPDLVSGDGDDGYNWDYPSSDFTYVLVPNATITNIAYSTSGGGDTTAPTGSVSVDSGATYTNTTASSLTLSAQDTGGSGLSEMRFSNDNAAWSTWETYATSKSWTLTSGNGAKTVWVQYRDGAGNPSPSYSDAITLDATAPSTASDVVSGQTYTGAQSFTLTPADTGGSGLAGTWWRLDGGAWTAGTLVPVAAPPSGTELHTLSWYSTDNATNTESAQSVSFSVALPDTTAPSTASDVVSGQTYTGAQSFTLTPADTGGSGLAGTWWALDAGAWNAGTSVPVAAPPSGTVPHTLSWYSRDMAGNTETTQSVSFSVSAADTTAPTGSVSVDSGATYTNTTASSLTLSAQDTGGSGLSEMRFSNDNAAWSTWETYATSKSWTLTSGNGAKTVWVQYRDGAGNPSPSYSDAITLDATAPSTASDVVSGQAYTGAQSFTLTPADTGGSGLAGTWWRLDGGAWTAGTLVPVAAPPSGTELHTLSWYSTDNATNTESAQSVSFSVTAAGGGAGTTSIVMSGEPPWVDAESGASGAWGTFTIYANGVSIGSKPVDATSTWDCPQTSVPSGARIDIVVDCGFSALGELYGQYRPLTYTTYLPAGSTRLEAATWTGFPDLVSGDGDDGYNWDYPSSDFTYVLVPNATITNIAYSTSGGGEAMALTSSDAITLDATAPSTTSDVVSGQTYAGAQSFTLTPADTGGSGLAGTSWRLDGGAWTAGTLVPVAAPVAGTVSHTLDWYSTDDAGNTELTKSVTLSVEAPAGTSTLAFIWHPEGFADAHLRVENASGGEVIDTWVSGSDTDLDLYVSVPSGQLYYMECLYYYEDNSGETGGPYGKWSNDTSINPDGVLSSGETVIWDY